MTLFSFHFTIFIYILRSGLIMYTTLCSPSSDGWTDTIEVIYSWTSPKLAKYNQNSRVRSCITDIICLGIEAQKTRK
jgi:hypothetical protein